MNPIQDRLIFLISTPRSGSTLLMRILNATSCIYSRPEPHMIPPLAHLGFWDTVEKAPFDQLQAQQAMRQFVADLPGGEKTYYEACRAYCDKLYGDMLSTAQAGERFFLDKTPANALVLPFLAQVYPNAKYIVLTRHPAAIFASYANSFFDGDYKAAVDFNPILSRYIPAMSSFMRENKGRFLHVSYEDVASKPEETLGSISSYLGIPFEPDALNYKSSEVAEGLGDPIGVSKHSRPVTSSIHKWAKELAADKKKFAVVAEQLAGVSDSDLETWGSPKKELWQPMEEADPASYGARKREWNRYIVTRRALVMLRRDIHRKPLGKVVKKIRFYCDVLLRG
jgi:hypothetical protein